MHLLHQYHANFTSCNMDNYNFQLRILIAHGSEISYIYLIADIFFSSRFLLIQQFAKIITTSPKQPLEISRFLFSDRQHPAIMTSAFLCSMLCRGLDAVWVRSIYFARELCIITALSITGAWYRNALYRLPEVWPVSVLTSPIRLRHTYTWFRHIRDGPDGLNRPWCKASTVV